MAATTLKGFKYLSRVPTLIKGERSECRFKLMVVGPTAFQEIRLQYVKGAGIESAVPRKFNDIKSDGRPISRARRS
jgi:hypothetical protein